MSLKQKLFRTAPSDNTTQSVPVAPNDPRVVWGVCLFLVAAVWVVFGQTLRHEFVNYDDRFYISDNPAILHGLSANGIVWAFTHYVNVNWTPLAVISHMLDCQLYGVHAGGHHLTSVLLHAFSAIALFLALKAMTRALWRSAFVAAVFAIHPLHVESVAWVAEWRDVLSGLFFMLTLGAYVRYVRQPSLLGRYVIVVLMLALGLMSKPMVVTLPLVLLLLDNWPLKRFSQPSGSLKIPWHLIIEKLPLLALSGLTCVVTLFAQERAIVSLPPGERIGNALVSYVAYIGQMICPMGLAVYYPYPGGGLAFGKVLAASVLLLAVTVTAVMVWQRQPWFLVGWLWYLGMMIPVIGVIQSGMQARADRYTYLPQIGLYILLTWAAVELTASWRNRRWLLGGGALTILVILMACARQQTAYWRNSETLWTHVLACTSNNSVAHNDLGNAFLQQGRTEEAIAQFQEALVIDPDNANFQYNLGNAFRRQGNVSEAVVQFQKALALNPQLAEAHYNLANAFLQSGRAEEAIAQFREALAAKPGYLEALNNLAFVLATCPQASLRNGSEAVKLAERANQIAGGRNLSVLCTLVAAYAEAGRFPEAIEMGKYALQLAESQSNTAVAETLQSQLKLYQTKIPPQSTEGIR